VLLRHQRVQEGQRNDLFRPENEVTDANLMLRKQAYYQGYMDALQFVVRLGEMIERALPIRRPSAVRTMIPEGFRGGE
jgi:hypothetical protein